MNGALDVGVCVRVFCLTMMCVLMFLGVCLSLVKAAQGLAAAPLEPLSQVSKARSMLQQRHFAASHYSFHPADDTTVDRVSE